VLVCGIAASCGEPGDGDGASGTNGASSDTASDGTSGDGDGADATGDETSGDTGGDTGDGSCVALDSAVTASFVIPGATGSVFDETECAVTAVSPSGTSVVIVLDCDAADPALPSPLEIELQMGPPPPVALEVGMTVRTRLALDAGTGGRALRIDQVGAGDPWILSIVDGGELELLTSLWPFGVTSVMTDCDPISTTCGTQGVLSLRIATITESVTLMPGGRRVGIEAPEFALSFGLREAHTYLDAVTCADESQSWFAAFATRDPD
jgi:hypothetical protein